MGRALLVVFTIFIGLRASANSCCGQSPASFTILSMDQTLSVSTGVSYLESVGRVYNDSEAFFVWNDKKRVVQSIPLNVASTLVDRHQVFLNTGLLQGHYQDSFENGYATNLSDTLLGYSFELLPEYSFSYWKPVVFVTALINLPTGHSIYDRGHLSEGGDVTGHGQWGAGLGVTLRKVYFPWTLTVQGRSIRLDPRQFDTVRVSDFYDSSLAFLVNYSSRWWGLQLNSGITFTHLSERKVAPSNVTSGVTQNFSVLAGLQRSISENWVAGLNYSDQTLVGPAKNTILSRNFNISFNYNYF